MTPMTNRFLLATLICLAVTAVASPARANVTTTLISADEDRADELYQEAREAIEEGRFDRAVERFNQVIELKSARTDAALYWKAYSLAKVK